MAAAVLLATSAAFAGWAVRATLAPRPDGVASSGARAPSALAPSTTPPKIETPVEPALRVAEPANVARAETDRSMPVSRHSAGRPHAAPSAEGSEPSVTAEGLFHDAAAARRADDVGLARTLYGELQRRFADSEEARLSHVSLGKLLLQSGRPSEAERQFAAYLVLGRRELAEEALIGRAQSLQSLGRSDDERSVWKELLGAYPSTVYAVEARRRLAELDAPAP
jgi:TolA-binding protein